MSNVILLLAVFICVLLAYVSYLLWLRRISRGELETYENMTQSYSESLETLERLLDDKGLECLLEKDEQCTLVRKGDDA